MQDTEASSQAWQAKAERAAVTAQRHQDALARQTGDNLVLVLKLRQAEEAAKGVMAQRNALHAQLQQQREPWFNQVWHSGGHVMPIWQQHPLQSTLHASKLSSLPAAFGSAELQPDEA